MNILAMIGRLLIALVILMVYTILWSILIALVEKENE